jgi:endonuclease/exonuclease/phosphatase family metal-dependent hydrolase
MKIKILTYNIHKGFNWNNSTYCIDAIKNVIINSKAEIIFLQEITGKNEKLSSKGLIDNQFEFIMDQLFPHYSYAKNVIYDHGHHGNMILSKYPIESVNTIDLSTNFLEKRGLLACTINIPQNGTSPEKNILACCLHLNLLHASRKKQYNKIINFIHKYEEKYHDYSYILAGDFNDWNQKSFDSFDTILDLKEVHSTANGFLGKTFPAKLPFFSLDRIYVKNLKIINSKVIKIADNLSDHLPLYCEVEIK